MEPSQGSVPCAHEPRQVKPAHARLRGTRIALAATALVAMGCSQRGNPVVCDPNFRPAGFFVSPTAAATGDGSWDNPWRLQTALSHPPAVRPGATIWLRGGTYRSVSWRSNLKGTVEQPIIVRQYPGERAILDAIAQPGVQGVYAFLVFGQHTWFWGFDLGSSSTDWEAEGAEVYSDRAFGITINRGDPPSPGVRFINMIIHDTQTGISNFEEIPGAETYGNILYYNGTERSDGPLGAAISVRNVAAFPTKKVEDNIAFKNFGTGIRAYSDDVGFTEKVTCEGNIVFSNGMPSRRPGDGWNFLIGGKSVAHGIAVTHNYTYSPSELDGGTNDIGLGGGVEDVTVRSNVFWGKSAIKLNSVTQPTFTSNIIYGAVAGFVPTDLPQNTYHPSRPTGLQVFVRPNRYEDGRAHIAVYNWDRRDVVPVDVSSVLDRGAPYELRDVQDLAGPPLVAGVYDGERLQVPMTGTSVTAPSAPTPAPITHTDKEFGAFLLVTVPRCP